MIETDIALYIEEQIGIPVIVGKRADRNDISIMNVGSLTSNSYTTELVSLQISVRNEDLDLAMSTKSEIVDALRGLYGKIGDSNIVIFIESVGSLIYEDDGAVAHFPIFINVKRI